MPQCATRSIKILLIALIVVAFAPLAVAQQPRTSDAQANKPAAESQPATSQATGTPSGSIPGGTMSPLSPGDLIDFSVYGVPEMSQRVRLNNDGVVYLPLLNEVLVGGLTTEEAQKKIEEQLVSGGFLKNPHVNISVAEYANGISVLGEVARPGVYPVSGPRRLFDVIASAGGLTPNAGTTVLVRPKGSDEAKKYTLSKDPINGLDAGILINPGDTVYIGKANLVYVVGEVIQPSGFMLDTTEPFTILKAIAMSRGVTRGAKMDGTRIIRKENGTIKEIPVNLSKIMKAQAPDVDLQADDIVFVPASTAKAIGKRTADVAIGLATGLTLVHAAN